MSSREIHSEATTVYDNYLGVLETGNAAALQAYARDLSRRIIPRGVETREVLGIVLLLRDVLARSLFRKYHNDLALLDRVLDAYEPAANRIANTVGASFIEQRERVIRRHEKAMQVLRVGEEERRRISRELHDEVGHALTVISMNLAFLARDGEAEKSQALREKIVELRSHLVEAMATVHNFAQDLRPIMLEELGLLPALRSYLKKFGKHTGLAVRFRGTPAVECLHLEQKTALFRIAQESLMNVAKHANATQVEVTLQSPRDGIRMRIKDNGKGFVSDQKRTGARGRMRLGLLGMRERARGVNGRIVIESAPGKGTAIIVQIPIKNGKRTAAVMTSRRDGSDPGFPAIN